MFEERVKKYTIIKLDPQKKYHIFIGTYQSYKYFDEYRAEILRQFVPNFIISNEGKKILENIQNDEFSVAVHVRRGDYVKINWALPWLYYKMAINIFRERFVLPHFYIFSDDIEWVKDEILKDNKNTDESYFFVEHVEPADPFEDIWIQSKCKGNILSASSYSWWAAYLKQEPEKNVIAPSTMRITTNEEPYLPGWEIIDIEKLH